MDVFKALALGALCAGVIVGLFIVSIGASGIFVVWLSRVVLG